MKTLKYFSLPLVLLLLSFKSLDSNLSALTVTQEMFRVCRAVNSMQYTMAKRERVDGELVSQESFTKVQFDPYHSYLKRVGPEPGPEVLYVEGWNNNKMLINPNGFPWVNVSMDPMSSRVRKGQHHTCLDNGYRKLIRYLEVQVEEFRDEFNDLSSVEDNLTFKGKAARKLTINNPHFEYVEHTVKKGETVQSIADHYMINAYRILEMNDDVDDYDGLDAGDVLTVPKYYCSKFIIWIEKARGVPIMMQVYDDLGLYEEYEYVDLKINPAFTDMDFDEDNPDYGF